MNSIKNLQKYTLLFLGYDQVESHIYIAEKQLTIIKSGPKEERWTEL